MRTYVAAIVLAGALGAGCGAEEVAVRLEFVRQDHFLHSSHFRVAVFPLPGDESCTRTLGDAISSSSGFDGAVFDSGVRPICELFAEEVVFADVPDGRFALVAITLDTDRTAALIAGCTSTDLTNGQSVATIRMEAVQHTYMTKYAGVTPTCITAEDKCTGACE